MKTIHAITKPGVTYPGFLNVSRDEDGSFVVTVRAAPKEFEGEYVCGHQSDAGQPGRCTPGDRHCNNYCNMAANKGPMQAHPMPCTQIQEGAQAQLKLSPEDFAALVANLAAA